MKTKLQDVRIIDIPKIVDPKGRGKLSVVEKDIIPFSIKRVYYLYDVPSDSYRGGHAHKNLIQFMIPLSGSFEVLLDDGMNKKKIMLNKPNKGLLIPQGIWFVRFVDFEFLLFGRCFSQPVLVARGDFQSKWGIFSLAVSQCLRPLFSL